MTQLSPPPAAVLDETMLFSGASVDAPPALVIVGAQGASVAASALDRLPGLQGALIVEPDLGAAQALRSEIARGESWGARADRCLVADLPDGASSAFALKLNLELCRFFVELGVPPAAGLVVNAASATPSSAEALARATVQDFCRGWSSRLLAAMAEHDLVPAAVLRMLADFLFETGERYHALKLYWFLHHARAQSDLAWRILECWADLRAFDQVALWLEQRPEFPPEFRVKLSQELHLERARDQGARQELYRRNLAALRAGFPEAASKLPQEASIEPSGGPTVVTLTNLPWRLVYRSDGLSVERPPYSMLVRIDGPLLREINPPADTVEIHRLLQKRAAPEDAHICIESWTRQSALVENLLSTRVNTGQPNWRSWLYLVESDLASLSVLLQTTDLGATLDPAETRLFLGPSAEAELLTFLRRDANRAIPGLADASPGLAARLQNLNADRAAQVRAATARLEALYSDGYPQQLLAALDGPERRPLRVLCLTSLYTSVVRHVIADLAATLNELGHDCLVLEEREPGEILHPQSVAATLLGFRPDFVVLVNHARPDIAPRLPEGLPVVTWILDEVPHHREASRVRQLRALDLTFAFSTSVQGRYLQLGYPHVGHLPFAVRAESIAGDIPAVCRDEVVYATHLGECTEPSFAPGLKGWLTERLCEMPEIPISRDAIDPLLAEALATRHADLPAGFEEELSFWACMLARGLDRIRVADTLLEAGIPLALYGRGWEALPRFRSRAHGVVEAGEPLYQALRSRKVVLHINRGCSVHPRLLEGFAAGGFVLARGDLRDQLPGETVDQFDIGRELFLFHNDQEMLALIRRALQDETWRRAAIQAAQARIRAQHTYRSRAETILTHLRRQLTLGREPDQD